jgi:hypothetical protein
MFQFSFSYNRINCKKIKLYYLLLNTLLSKIYCHLHIHIYSYTFTYANLRTLQARKAYSVCVTADYKPRINEDEKCKELVRLSKLACISVFVLPQVCLYVS